MTDVSHGGYHLAPHLYEAAAVIDYPQIQVGKLRLSKVVQGHTARAAARVGLNVDYEHRTCYWGRYSVNVNQAPLIPLN